MGSHGPAHRQQRAAAVRRRRRWRPAAHTRENLRRDQQTRSPQCSGRLGHRCAGASPRRRHRLAISKWLSLLPSHGFVQDDTAHALTPIQGLQAISGHGGIHGGRPHSSVLALLRYLHPLTTAFQLPGSAPGRPLLSSLKHRWVPLASSQATLLRAPQAMPRHPEGFVPD